MVLSSIDHGVNTRSKRFLLVFAFLCLCLCLVYFCVCFLCWRVCVGGRSAELESEAWEPSAAQAVFLYACVFCGCVFLFLCLCLCLSLWVAKHNKNTQTSATLNCKIQQDYAEQRNPELQNTIRLRRPAQP